MLNNNNETYGIWDRFLAISQTFVNVNNLNKTEFLNKAFFTTFELIPEAEKGSYFELQHGKFVPICVNGYDRTLISNLVFDEAELSIGFGHSMDLIDAYSITTLKREDKKFDSDIIDTFKALGTYECFTSLYAPIVINNKTIGLISLDNFNNHAFSKESKMLLKLFAQIISNFYSIRLQQEISNKRNDDIISALVSAIEIKDVYMKGHAHRVLQLSTGIGRTMNLKSDVMRDIRYAAILHDVGKIGVPTDILIKPGRLTDEEFAIVKTHCEQSKKLLESIEGFEEVSEIAYSHHEHFDGSGYPRGLSNDEIRIEAQIIQVADAFDAMTSRRSYREPLTKEKAMEVIVQESGKQFSPRIVTAFIDFMTREEEVSFDSVEQFKSIS